MRYPLAGRETLAALTTGSGLTAGAVGLAKAAARRAIGPLAGPLALAGGLIWLGRNLGDAFVELGDEALRVKLGVLFDETISLADIAKVSETRWKIVGGLGVRTNLRDMIAVVTTSGPVAELSFWRPLSLPVIPRIYSVRAQRLLVSPEHLETFIGDLRARLQK